MKKIIAARILGDKSFEKMGRDGQSNPTIKRIIKDASGSEDEIGVELSLYCVDGTTKKIISSSELVGETLKIGTSETKVEILENNIYNIIEPKYESLTRDKTKDQLKKLRAETKGIDIGDRIPDMNIQGSNIQYIHNAVDTGIESYEDYEKKGKNFIPSWNLKHLLSPYKFNANNTKKHGKKI